jgi:hypothetical protein
VTLLASRLQHFPAWLRLVATTRREPEVLNKLSTLRAAAIDAHRQANLDDLDRFIAARLETPNLAERLAASRVPLATVQQKLRARADGNFLYVAQALQDIERDNYSFSRLDELPQGLNQWYEAWLARKFPNPKTDYGDARKVLEVILAAREPLTLELLRDMTGLDPHYALPDAVAALAPLVVETGGRHALFHKSLADWLPDNRSKYRAARAAGLQMVLRYLDEEIAQDPRLWGPYALRHALGHFAGVRFENGRTPLSPAERDLLRPYAHHWDKANGYPAFHRSRAECGIDRLFLSYARRESAELAARLKADLTRCGLRISMDLDDWQPMVTSISDALDRQIATESDTILVLAGAQYLERLREDRSFLAMELRLACCHGKGVIVLSLDPGLPGPSWQGFPVVDFTDWQHRYPERLTALLRWFMVRNPDGQR